MAFPERKIRVESVRLRGRAKLPPKTNCRECGADMGRSWREAPLCKDCGQLKLGDECICVYETTEGARVIPFEWNPLCEVHTSDPYDIPF